MIPVLSGEEYRRVDHASPVPVERMMESAGHAVALAAVRHGARYGSRVVVLAGTGNNGGDGYVAARHLARRGVAVRVEALGDPKTALALQASAAARAAGVPVRELADPDGVDLVIDALFGGGFRGDLPPAAVPWTRLDVPVVSIDVPSGLDHDDGEVAGDAFTATETVTFHTYKTGHFLGEGIDRCGLVTVVDIGMEGGTPAFFVAEESDAPLPMRERRTHKWTGGSVLVVGGSTGMVGAVVLAAKAALSFGASAVGVVSPRSDMVSEAAPELLVYDTLDAVARRYDIAVIGPGLDEADGDLASAALESTDRALLDAGALHPDLIELAHAKGVELILTPHAGEFSRVFGVNPGTFAVRASASKARATVVLKGNPTRISSGDAPVFVTTGGPELATIGTGDVLAGMIAALWGRGLYAPVAAVSGVYWHGVAGRDLARERTVTAARLADHVAGFAFLPLATGKNVGRSIGGAARGGS